MYSVCYLTIKFSHGQTKSSKLGHVMYELLSKHPLKLETKSYLTKTVTNKHEHVFLDSFTKQAKNRLNSSKLHLFNPVFNFLYFHKTLINILYFFLELTPSNLRPVWICNPLVKFIANQLAWCGHRWYQTFENCTSFFFFFFFLKFQKISLILINKFREKDFLFCF